MARKKQLKIDEALTFPNVFVIYDGHTEDNIYEYLDKTKPITLEVGCGHGHYSLNLAKLYPEKNFVGIDLMPSRIHKGASEALKGKITNVAFMVGRAEKLVEVFNSKNIDEIWVPFPDPHARRRSAFRRLISPNFLEIYRTILKKDGIVNFKTDDTSLFEYAKQVLEKEDVVIHKLYDNLYNGDHDQLLHEIQTTYEKRFIEEGRTIKFVSFSFNR